MEPQQGSKRAACGADPWPRPLFGKDVSRLATLPKMHQEIFQLFENIPQQVIASILGISPS